MTSLVNVDLDTAPKLVEWVASILGDGPGATAFRSESEKLVASSSYSQLVFKIIEQSEVVLGLDNDADIEGFFQALVSVTLYENSSGGNIQENLPAMQKAVDVLVSGPGALEKKPKLRLRILVSLFNMSFSPQTKHLVLSAIFKFAVASGQTSLVQGFHAKVVDWAKEWNLPVVDKRSLFLLVSELLESAKESSLALGFFVQYLSTFGKDTALTAEAQSLALTAVKAAIKSPTPAFTDRNKLLECINQQQTLAAGALASLVDLLRIVCCDTLTAYRAYEAKNKAVMSEHGISPDDLATKMRLLTLCSLGVQTQNPSYSQVAASLEIPESDVELWVVDAIASGLLEANMDQFQKVVTITRYAHRSFGVDNWKSARVKLADLQKKVQGVLATIEGGN